MLARQQRAAWAVDVAATSLGGLQILEERTANDAPRAELLARVLEAAGRSTLGSKVRALGRVLADGVRDGGPLDEAFALAAALDDLEAAHVLVLKFLADTPLPPEALRRPNHAEPKGLGGGQIVEVLPDVASMVEPVVSVLTRHGLLSVGDGVAYPGSIGPAVYRVAPLGHRCLFLLHDDGVQRQA